MDSKFISAGGFLGGTADTPQSEGDIRTLFDCGTLCLQGGRTGEAYACYARIREANSAVWFNRSLCLLNINEYTQSIVCLQHAERLLKSATPTFPADGFQTKLDERDANGNEYLYPMAYDMPRLFPQRVRVQILRTMADAAFRANLNEEVRRIAGSLAGHYKNIDEILKLLK